MGYEDALARLAGDGALRVRDQGELARLAKKLDWCAGTHRRLLTGEVLPEAEGHDRSGYNPLGEALRAHRAGDRDEALWLHFVATVLGWDRPDSANAFLRVVGRGERAAWAQVREDPDAAVRAVNDNVDVLAREAPFGNHRKYETHAGTARVLASFVALMGPSPSGWVDEVCAGAAGPEDAFDRLYHALDVHRFGRTARYDFARLLANLEPDRLRPGRCYLRGASGPRRGAALLFLGRERVSDAEVAQLEEGCRRLAEACGADLQVVEDAVCNWQKELPRGWRPGRGEEAEPTRPQGTAFYAPLITTAPLARLRRT